jgi:uncharacterized membrane protein YphA (DoxX/SURF4 family)
MMELNINRNKVLRLGTTLYLSGILVGAVYNFFKQDFALTRPRPYPDFVLLLNPGMAYISGGVLFIAIGLYSFKKHRTTSLFILAATFFLFATTRHMMLLWRDPINSFKSLWIIGAALLLITTYPKYQKFYRQALFANIIIPFTYFQYCGLAHFSQAELVTNMIPAYIPFQTFFTYFTGITLILASIALLIPNLRTSAAFLSAFQICGWLLLLHIPNALTIGGDEWIGVGETLSFTGICLILYYYFKNSSQPIPYQT